MTAFPQTVFACGLVFGLALGCNRPERHRSAEPESNAQAPENQEKAKEQTLAEEMLRVQVAKAELEAAPGQEVEGAITFEQNPQGVRVVGTLAASPGPHGFHVHEIGDCSNIPGKSMGDHFAPGGHDHALPDESPQRHLGDLGNVVINADRTGKVDFLIVGASLDTNNPHSLLGKAVVLHASEDRGKSKQPAGDSGPPIACGVIRAST